jgi:hypothetical protein
MLQGLRESTVEAAGPAPAAAAGSRRVNPPAGQHQAMVAAAVAASKAGLSRIARHVAAAYWCIVMLIQPQHDAIGMMVLSSLKDQESWSGGLCFCFFAK